MRGMEYVNQSNRRERKGKVLGKPKSGKPASGKRGKPWAMRAGLGNC